MTDPSRNELDSLPRLTLTLSCNTRQVDVIGLVDSGATINVLPYEIGVHLKETWDDRKANIKLAGNGVIPRDAFGHNCKNRRF